MKTIYLLLTAILMFSACGAPATNAPSNANSNANANAAKPVAAAPTMDMLFEMDKKANEAWAKGDVAYFDKMLSSNFVGFEQGQRMSRAEMLEMMRSMKCDAKSWNLEEPQMTKINDDAYVISYKASGDVSCSGPDGKAMKAPSPVRAATLWVREGTDWKGAFHGEVPIIDPKSPPPPPPAKADDTKKDAPAAANSNASSDAATAPAKAAPSANTDALVKLHGAGWEAFKAKDANWFNANLTNAFSFIDPIGGFVSGKANAVKQWTETMKCEGITKTSVSNGMAAAISPTLEVLYVKGSADGTCDGQKNGDLHQVAVYVKEGDAWKLAYMVESPAM